MLRNDAGTVCVSPIPASHHRADNRRLPVRELRPFLHRPDQVLCERRRVCFPALPQEVEAEELNEMLVLKKVLFFIV